MSSHSACSSREFCMTCAAPKNKGRMRCPDGEAVEWVNRKGGVTQEGGVGRRGHTEAPVCMCGGVSSSSKLSRPWTLTSLSDLY